MRDTLQGYNQSKFKGISNEEESGGQPAFDRVTTTSQISNAQALNSHMTGYDLSNQRKSQGRFLDNQKNRNRTASDAESDAECCSASRPHQLGDQMSKMFNTDPSGRGDGRCALMKRKREFEDLDLDVAKTPTESTPDKGLYNFEDNSATADCIQKGKDLLSICITDYTLARLNQTVSLPRSQSAQPPNTVSQVSRIFARSTFTASGNRASQQADFNGRGDEAVAIAQWLAGLRLGQYIGLLLDEGWDCLEVRTAACRPGNSFPLTSQNVRLVCKV